MIVPAERGVGFRAYDGSTAGPANADVTLEIRSPRAVQYLASAPSQLGLARAYVTGDLEIIGDAYTALSRLYPIYWDHISWSDRLKLVRAVRPEGRPPPGPAAAGAHPQRPSALEEPRRRRDPPPLRREQPLLLVGARARRWPTPARSSRPPTPPSRRRRRRSSTSSAASSASSPACACSTSAAAGAAWSCTPSSTTASRPSASPCRSSRHGTARSRSSRPGLTSQARDPLQRLPRRRRVRLRRGVVHRPHRAHRPRELPVLLLLPLRQAPPRGPAAQPHHHPPERQLGEPLPQVLHQPLRVPRRRALRSRARS